MDNFEKVERLREKADVTYDEAKRALEACNYDMLDAMIYLEALGKVKKTSDTAYYSSKAEEEKLYDVEKTVKDREKKSSEEGFKNGFKKGLEKFFKVCKENHFIVKHQDKKVIDIPLGLAIIIFLLGWHVLLIVMLVSFFFECKYSIEGKNDLKTVNSAMDKVAETADKLKKDFAENVDEARNERNSEVRNDNTTSERNSEARNDKTTSESKTTKETGSNVKDNESKDSDSKVEL